VCADTQVHREQTVRVFVAQIGEGCGKHAGEHRYTGTVLANSVYSGGAGGARGRASKAWEKSAGASAPIFVSKNMVPAKKGTGRPSAAGSQGNIWERTQGAAAAAGGRRQKAGGRRRGAAINRARSTWG